MTQDALSPDDRALHDAFFEAYKAKHDELKTNGPEINLDVCTVHAIRAMQASRLETVPLQAIVDEAVGGFNEWIRRKADAIPGYDIVDPEAVREGVRAAVRLSFNRVSAHMAGLPFVVEAVGRGVRFRSDEEGGA